MDEREAVKKIINAKNAMETIINIRRNTINVIDEKIRMFNDADKMATRGSYEMNFDLIEERRRDFIKDKELINSTSNKLNEFNDVVNVCIEKTDKLAEAVNNNRLKFGLKGQIKQTLTRQRRLGERPRMTLEQRHAFQQPYAETPADIIGRGGKKTRKRHKSKRHKSKKTKTKSR
jgi:hypothetical protein